MIEQQSLSAWGDLIQNAGIAGAVIIALFWQIIYLQKKLLQIVENNTRAMSELRDHCLSRKVSA